MLKMYKFKNREAWLEARQRFLGGSDIASIMGLNAWKNNVQLYREKKGIVMPDDISDNPLVIYGTKAEEHIRALFELDHPELKVEYVPDNSWRNSKYPFGAASLDGWLTDEKGRKGILEIKTSTITSSQANAKWKDKIPDNYYCQVLYYLGITGWDYVFLRANLKYAYPDSDVYTVTRDYFIERSEVEDDIATIMEMTAMFAKSLEENKEPSLLLTL